jgi:hypothetical protein
MAPDRHVLVDTIDNVRSPESWQVLPADVEGSPEGWFVRFQTLHGGKQEGSTLLILDNGLIEVAVIPTRGMGIAWIKSKQVKLGWESPVRETVHPSFMNLESRGGLGWLEGFNEWMCRCGLEWSGHPGMDEFVNNVGAKEQMMLTLHGKIANIPASHVEVRIEREGDSWRLSVSGDVHERLFHGPKLMMKSEISVLLGTTSCRIRDAVTNQGACPQECQLMYHCNFGAPLLEAGARVIANPLSNEPFNDRAREGLATYDVLEAPKAGFVEQVYCLTLAADTRGKAEVLLQSADAARGASMSFLVAQLPCFTVWKNTAANEDGYVCGLEPGTSFARNRKLEREAGRVPVLQPGETREFGLEVTLHGDADSVKTVRERIQGS